MVNVPAPYVRTCSGAAYDCPGARRSTSILSLPRSRVIPMGSLIVKITFVQFPCPAFLMRISKSAVRCKGSRAGDTTTSIIAPLRPVRCRNDDTYAYTVYSGRPLGQSDQERQQTQCQ